MDIPKARGERVLTFAETVSRYAAAKAGSVLADNQLASLGREHRNLFIRYHP